MKSNASSKFGLISKPCQIEDADNLKWKLPIFSDKPPVKIAPPSSSQSHFKYLMPTQLTVLKEEF